METAIVFDQVLGFGAEHLPHDFIEGFTGNLGVDLRQGGTEATFQNHIAGGVAFGVGFAGGDVGSMQGGIAQFLQVGQGHLFNI